MYTVYSRHKQRLSLRYERKSKWDYFILGMLENLETDFELPKVKWVYYLS